MTDEVNRIRPAFRATMSLATHLAMLIVDATLRINDPQFLRQVRLDERATHSNVRP
ncbi:hypothetical protein [Paenarthrobacter sp. JL.01a]|uniref:hypothetical protein n=1 Tax=Paenarthrobacter sp. JL.01a TaxID=2979324 RepID=UPI0021C7D6CF|nr:hypothetical protein [Paenarthrobacter sp. JL.01a]UXM91917.1 hypothetical protein N5P29_00955 [Paenarthrobacter sp. JL.01a]